MRITLVTTEFLGVGQIGGVGVCARMLGRSLAGRGHDVAVVLATPRGAAGQRARIDGIDVRTHARTDLMALTRLVRDSDPDVVHCIQASVGAWLAGRAVPDCAHVIDLVDPRGRRDWAIEFSYPTKSRLKMLPSFAYFASPPARLSVRRADALQVPAGFLREKAQCIYGLNRPPLLAPMPVEPPQRIQKSPTPLVVFVGRLDARKRPDLFVELAQSFPAVRFVAIGAGAAPARTAQLHHQASSLDNLSFTGFIDQLADNRFHELLGSAWILVNTSAREGLPVSFIEAASHGCAILSACDPDGYASRFGHAVTDGDYGAGLDRLLSNDRWGDLGAEAAAHVARHHDPVAAADRQRAIYADAMAQASVRQHRSLRSTTGGRS